MKLKPPFPSSPSRPAVCDIKVTHAERDMMHVHSFGALYSAKKMVDALIGDSEYTEINETCIKTDLGIKIKSDQLSDIMKHKYTAEEKEWELPNPYPRMVQLFRGESYKPEDKHLPKKAVMPTRVDKPEKAERVPRKPKPDGMITIQDLCAEMKLDPGKARAALRKSNTPKPEHGWAWEKKDVDAIKKIIKDAK